ncbi:MAG: condensation domain-containing protein [Promethearchaeota archaeon]
MTQLQTIQYKEFERKLVPHERRFFRVPISNISIVARLKGFISKEDLRKGLKKVRHQHPLLGVRIYLDENYDTWFTSKNVPENPLKVVQRKSEKDWYQELLNEYKIRFKVERGPLARFILLQSSEISEIIITCHHIICDGTSMAILARDLLLYLGDPDREVQIMPDPPLATPEIFPTDTTPGKMIMVVINKMNKMWQKKKVIFDDEDVDNIFRAYWNNFTFKVISVELTKIETSDLSKRCRQHKVTLNSALNTAFLAARYDIRGHFKGGRRNILIPVNTRKRYIKPVGENFGLYAAGFQFELSYNPKKDFWENAKIFNENVREKLKINKVFKMVALMGLIDKSLSETQSFSFLGKLVPPNFSRYEKIHSFSIDKKNIANKMTRKKIEKVPGLAVTNLGLLDYPSKYGSLELDRFIFVTSASPLMELVISAVTVSGRLTFTINYLEETTDTITMEKIKNKALEYLGIV